MPDYDKFIRNENHHLNFLSNSFIDGRLRINGAELVYSEILADNDWNYATAFNKEFLNSRHNLDVIISFYQEKKLLPCVYISPYNYDVALVNNLRAFGFVTKFSDVWMFYQGGELLQITTHPELSIQVVQSEQQQKDFIEVFFAAYSSDEPSNFYEVDKSYQIPVERTFNKHSEGKFRHIVAYVAGTPVGCAYLAYNHEVAGIYCVGVIPSYRKYGVGKEMMHHLINFAKSQDLATIFLLTEKDSYAELFYTKLNFKTEFVCHGLILK